MASWFRVTQFFLIYEVAKLIATSLGVNIDWLTVNDCPTYKDRKPGDIR